MQDKATVSGSNYLVPMDDRERARLDLQHQVITRCFGNKLLLSPVALKGGDKALDSGAGACSWLLDLVSKNSSDVEFYGSDINSAIFPKDPPSNVKLFAASAVELPKDWTDNFQLVHQRLFIGALSSKQWDSALRELFRVTKPGGWVELCEFGADIISPSNPNHKAFEIRKAIFTVSDHIRHISTLLPDKLREVGFTDIHTVEVDMPLGKRAGLDGDLARDALSGFIRGMKKAVLDKGGLGVVESEKEFDEAMDDFDRLCDETPDTLVKYFTVYGQKPF